MPATRSSALRPGRSAACALCRGRDCCRSFAVPLTARDLARLCAATTLPPTSFCRAVSTGTEQGFVLDPHSPLRYGLELMRRDPGPVAVGDARAPCVFLLELPGELSRCSLGPAQPAVCRTFPVTIDPLGSLVAVEGVGCERVWSPADLDPATDRAPAEALQRELEELAELTEEWNERILRSRAPAALAEFCAFLMDAVRIPGEGGSP